MIQAGALETFQQARDYALQGSILYTLSYANAALITIFASLLFACLYTYCRPISPELALMGLVFVPVYAALNLCVYLSQITLVPALLQISASAEYRPAADLLLMQLLQAYPFSWIAFMNNLAYALLGIPSILFGLIMLASQKLPRLAGLLLALNGIACILGVMGSLSGSRLLGSGSLLGGVLFLAALFPLASTLFDYPKSSDLRPLPTH